MSEVERERERKSSYALTFESCSNCLCKANQGLYLNPKEDSASFTQPTSLLVLFPFVFSLFLLLLLLLLLLFRPAAVE